MAEELPPEIIVEAEDQITDRVADVAPHESNSLRETGAKPQLLEEPMEEEEASGMCQGDSIKRDAYLARASAVHKNLTKGCLGLYHHQRPMRARIRYVKGCLDPQAESK